MNLRHTGLIIGALAVCAACMPTPASKMEELSAAEVSAAYMAFEGAWEREDLEAAVATFTPDAVVFDPVPPGRFEGPDAIRKWTAGSFDALDRISIASTQIQIQTKGPVAWGTSHFVFEAQQNGAPLRAEGDLTMLWVRQADGSLKMTVFHASHLPPAGDSS